VGRFDYCYKPPPLCTLPFVKARAAIADGKGHFTLEKIEVGAPTGDEVLVEIKAAGICHTDHASLNWKRPLIMGHEGAGIVRSVGPQVNHVQAGYAVVLNWAVPCGKCFQCQRGEAVLCEDSKPAYVMERSNAHAHAEGTTWKGAPVERSFNLGTLSTHALVRAAAVTPLPSTVPFASACIVGCGVMTGFGSAVNVAKVAPDSSVAVIGCGGVGLNIIQGARVCKAGKIIAIDVRQAGLEQARRFGATDTLVSEPGDAGLESLAQAVKKLTGGRGADYAFEATSVPAFAFAPLRLVRNGGMALQVSGINDPVSVPMPWFMWNKIYLTPLYGGCVPSRDFSRIFEHYRRGEIMLDELVTRRYRLEHLGQAIEDMLTGRNAKGIIEFD
jgi:S-(hydroxymethyl)glutathione dehydrogenase/alcohol dehydrogenase